MRRRDWVAVAEVYEEGIATGDATFETSVPSWAEWHAAHLADHRLVAAVGNEIVGWAALAPLSDLVLGAERAEIWTVQAGIFPENRPSLRLHHACGFRTVGLRERIGRLDG